MPAMMGVVSPPERHPPLWSRAWEDVRAVLRRDPSASSALDVVLFATGLHVVWAYRWQHWLWERGLRRLAILFAQRTRRRYGIDIHPAATIGRRFVIDHGFGLVIGQTSVIGDDCMIYQGVTLGMTGHHGGRRHPTLGDDVMVGAGAIVLGDIHVGSHSKVGAGAVVVHDVPEGVTVAGVPARVMGDRCREGRCELSLVPPVNMDSEDVRWSCAL